MSRWFPFLRTSFDWVIPTIVLILAVISVATIYTITFVSVGGGLALSQLIYFLIGIVLFVLFSLFDYRQLKDLAIPLFVSSLLLLIPLYPTFSHKLPFVICEFNSCRWINLGIFRFQTSEIIKLAVLVLLAAFLGDRIGKVAWQRGVLFFIILLIPAILISQQPDLGTAIVVVVSGGVVLLMSRFPWWFWLSFFLILLIMAPVGWKNLKPYQKKRVEIFLNPDLDPEKTGYNVKQAEIAVGSGGILGRGFGQGSQSQLNFLPVAHTDFIFAGYAEATGFVGSLFILGLYALLIARAVQAAELAKDGFGRLLAMGIAAQLMIQVTINIGMNIRLLPVTGVPLPLVSFGGTSVFVTLMCLGILESIVIRHKPLRFD